MNCFVTACHNSAGLEAAVVVVLHIGDLCAEVKASGVTMFEVFLGVTASLIFVGWEFWFLVAVAYSGSQPSVAAVESLGPSQVWRLWGPW